MPCAGPQMLRFRRKAVHGEEDALIPMLLHRMRIQKALIQIDLAHILHDADKLAHMRLADAAVKETRLHAQPQRLSKRHRRHERIDIIHIMPFSASSDLAKQPLLPAYPLCFRLHRRKAVSSPAKRLRR